jgi:hypothetical protein
MHNEPIALEEAAGMALGLSPNISLPDSSSSSGDEFPLEGYEDMLHRIGARHIATRLGVPNAAIAAEHTEAPVPPQADEPADNPYAIVLWVPPPADVVEVPRTSALKSETKNRLRDKNLVSVFMSTKTIRIETETKKNVSTETRILSLFFGACCKEVIMGPAQGPMLAERMIWEF